VLITRGSLTTFQCHDVAKYFAIIRCVRDHVSAVAALDVMRLASPNSAILSAVIFNALIIVLLIHSHLKGSNIERSVPLLCAVIIGVRLGGIVGALSCIRRST